MLHALWTAKQAPEKAAAPLGLGIGLDIVTGGHARFGPRRHFALAARRLAAQHHLGVLYAILLHQIIKRGGILWRDTHAAMRHWLAEMLHLIAAVDGMPVLHKEDGMRHGGVVPLLAVPDFIHRSWRKGS
jgi:hypothetical protein